MYVVFLVKPHLQLALDGVVGTMDELCIAVARTASQISTLVNILNLHATLLVEPVLQATDGFVLVVAQVCIEVEEVVRANQLQPLPQFRRTKASQRNCSRQVSAPTMRIAVPAVQIFAMHIESPRLVVSTDGTAMTLVVLSVRDERIVY